MKAIAVLAVVLLMCAFVHSAEIASENEIDSTIADMVSIESTHSIVSSLAAEAQAAQTKSGVTRLVHLLRKVLKRLRRSMKRGSKKVKKTKRVCKSSIQTARAVIKVAKRDLKVATIKYRINKNTISKAKHDAASYNARIGRETAEASTFDNRIKSERSSLDVDVGRMSRGNAETLALVKLLRKINRKLTNNGLAEISSKLTEAAKGRAAESESTTMLLAVAAKAQSGSDVSDVHDMIKLLIKALLADIKGNQRQITRRRQGFQQLSRTLRRSADAERDDVKSVTKTRDRTRSSGDRAAKKNMALRVQMRALKKTIKSAKRRLAVFRKNCRSAKKGFMTKRRSYLRQIRVIKQIIKMLKNKKLSSATAAKIAGVKLNLPVWRVGKWSRCSAKCGLGKKTRRVSCSGSKCLGNKPRKTKSCTRGPCKSDCIVSRWSSYSKCSSKCRGVQKKTRKVLAQATAGGKACPAPSGLKKVRACNTKCTKRFSSKKGKGSRKVSKRSRKSRKMSKRSRKSRKGSRKSRKMSKRSRKSRKGSRKSRKSRKMSKRSRKSRKMSKRSRKSRKGSRKSRKGSRKSRKMSKRSRKSRKGSRKGKRSIRMSRKARKVHKRKAVAHKKSVKKLNRKLGGLKKKLRKTTRRIKNMVSEIKNVETKAQFLALKAKLKKLVKGKRSMNTKKGKVLTSRFAHQQNGWRHTAAGIRAHRFCKNRGLRVRSDAYTGCMHDIRLTGDKKMAAGAARNTKKVTKKVAKVVPRPCQVSAWSSWSKCSSRCGGGVQTATRTVTKRAKHGGKACPGLKKSKPCNTKACPIDCLVTEWSAWSACSKSCGGGVQTQTRSVSRSETSGGRACPVNREQKRACNIHACPRPVIRVATPPAETPCNAQGCSNPPALRRNVRNLPSRWAVSCGDPHTVNFQGDYYHMQQPGIITMAKTDDGLFEVQIYQDGYWAPGTPSYVREVRIRYKGQVYHENFNRDGFYVSGHGQLYMVIPGAYQGYMRGALGLAAGPGAHNFQNQNGQQVNVGWSYGSHHWGWSGYGGPHSYVSRFQDAWKPKMEDCLFGASRCQANLAGRRRQTGCHYCFWAGCFWTC